MGKIGIFEVLTILVLVAGFFSIIVLAFYKVIKSKLPDWEKIYWCVAFCIFNLIAAIPFIIFHDYFLSSDLRGSKES
jgi:hypothetical protein